jgi:hypothetical protein
MFMPTEIIVVASLRSSNSAAHRRLLVCSGASGAVAKVERLRFPAPHESAFRCGVRNRSTSAVIAIMSASIPVANR